MLRKKIINASSNLKKGLHLGTKIKSNRCLDMGTEGVRETIMNDLEVNELHKDKIFDRTIVRHLIHVVDPT